MHDVLAATKRDISTSLQRHPPVSLDFMRSSVDTYQVLAGLAGNPYAVDQRQCMVQLSPALLVPALNRTAALRHAAMARGHPLHRVRVEREEVVPSMVVMLTAAVRDAARGREMRADLARVHRIREDRGAKEDGRAAIRVVADGLPELLGRRQLCVGAEWDAEAGRRRRLVLLLLVGRWLGAGHGELGRLHFRAGSLDGVRSAGGAPSMVLMSLGESAVWTARRYRSVTRRWARSMSEGLDAHTEAGHVQAEVKACW